jgi:prophage maintenance system killer protein
VSEPIFLELDEVIRIHARSLAEHGGRDGVRDLRLVESALVFLAKNGIYATPATWELYNAMIDAAEKKKSKADLAEIFHKRATE